MRISATEQQNEEVVGPRLVPLGYWRAALAEVSLCHPEVPPDDKPIAIAEQDGRWLVTDASPSTAEWVAKQFYDNKARNKDMLMASQPSSSRSF
jgi:hypothetical protein